MNQFFYNMATTTWALKHVLFVIEYNVITISMHGEGNQRSFGSYKHATESVEQQLNENV